MNDKKVDGLNNDSHTFLKESKEKYKTKKIIIDYCLDWESSSASKLAEHLTVVDDILEKWHAEIVSEDTAEDYTFYLDEQGEESVREYFMSRDLEMPHTYYHENFIKSGSYRIQHIKLEVSIKIWNNRFVNRKGEIKNQDEFITYLNDRLEFCHKGYYYKTGGLAVNIVRDSI